MNNCCFNCKYFDKYFHKHSRIEGVCTDSISTSLPEGIEMEPATTIFYVTKGYECCSRFSRDKEIIEGIYK